MIALCDPMFFSRYKKLTHRLAGRCGFALEQDVEATIAETSALTGQLHQTLLQAVVLPLRLVVQQAARQPQQTASAALGHLGPGPHGYHGIASCLRAQNFPRATTFSASLSSIASASIFLSLAFSASRAFRRLASG